jgi:hypothetical protein
MDKFMSLNRDAATGPLRALFNETLDRCYSMWGDNAFYKPVDVGWRTQLISPLYDAQMVGASLLNPSQVARLAAKQKEVVNMTRALFESDPEFVKSVSQSTNNAASIKKRVSTIYELLVSLAK